MKSVSIVADRRLLLEQLVADATNVFDWADEVWQALDGPSRATVPDATRTSDGYLRVVLLVDAKDGGRGATLSLYLNHGVRECWLTVFNANGTHSHTMGSREARVSTNELIRKFIAIAREKSAP